MNRMTAVTVSAGATASAAGLVTCPPNLAFTIGPPAAARTSRNVPNSSENRRRHSYWSSVKSNCRRAALDISPVPCRRARLSGWLVTCGSPAGRLPGSLTGELQPDRHLMR